ncbi:damage-inducible protein CinA [Streptococcus pseudopneumoniae]|nr:damage-inducible protein CinA [Streptococcus pseudopneumoniae]
MVGVFWQQTFYPATRASHQPSRSTAGLQELVRGGQGDV